jgi:hypothetical protein
MATTTSPASTGQQIPAARLITLYASDAALGTGTVTSGDITGLIPYSMADIVVDATISGTTTLNVYVQKLLPNGSYTDIISFTQISATGKRYAAFLPNAATADQAIQDAALTAGTIAKNSLGAVWRIKGVVAGASANAQFNVYADFY